MPRPPQKKSRQKKGPKQKKRKNPAKKNPKFGARLEKKMFCVWR